MKQPDATVTPEPAPKKLTRDDVKTVRGGMRVSTQVNSGTLHYNKIKW